MGSSRFPGKMMSDIGGRPALLRLIERLKQATTVESIVLATTRQPVDDPLVQLAETAGVRWYRGSEDDVLNRVVEAHRMMSTELVVEVTGDCTLIDPKVIDLGVTTFVENDIDVVANVVEPSYPMGIDVQVFRLAALEEVESEIRDPAVR